MMVQAFGHWNIGARGYHLALKIETDLTTKKKERKKKKRKTMIMKKKT